MRLLLFVLCACFSSPIFASTIITGTAVNALQRPAEFNPKKDAVNKAKQTVKIHEKAQSQKDAIIKDATDSSSSSQMASSVNKAVRRLADSVPTSKEELDKRLEDEEILQETESVDYKRPIQIFYKNECKSSQEDCHRGPVFTNIPSLIFDYVHNRGSFSKVEIQKK